MAGRPKYKITPKVCKEAEELAAQGLTLKQIANNLGIAESTLHLAKNGFSEFSESIKRGRDQGICIATNSLFTQVKKGDIAAIKCFLYNVDSDNWKDKRTTELTGTVGLHDTFVKEFEE